MNKVIGKIREFLTYTSTSGSSSPGTYSFFETSDIPLENVMQLYYRDPTCKSSVDLLAASTVGMGFYTTVNEKYPKAVEAKSLVDTFCENVNLDKLLNDMAKNLIACGNDFWLKLSPGRLNDVLRLPIDAICKIELGNISGLRVPHDVTGYRLKSQYSSGAAQGVLAPDALIHWQLNPVVPTGFGVGLLQVLLHTLTVDNSRRPAFAAMKAKIERLMPKVIEKYAGPDVVVGLPGAKPEVLKTFERAIKNRPEEGTWLFHSQKDATVTPVSIDPRAVGFTNYIDHMINQFYLGCETPLPRLFSTPGFTEASARAALDLQNMLIRPVQRYVKRQVERELFSPLLSREGFDPVAAGVRLNWGSPELPELLMSDLISAAEKGLIRTEEFRKNAAKSGWELWDSESPSVGSPGSGNSGNGGESN